MIPLYKPYMPELPLIDEILHSGQLAYGKYTREFERKLQKFFGTPYVIAVSSFNMAIQVTLTSLELRPGDEVIASPMACLASTQPYQSAGYKVRWADIDPHRGTLDPDSVKKQIKKTTKAIIHNHFCGYPGYIDEINEIGREYGIPVINDGIECFGSEYKGKKIGNCGTEATVFSLNPVRVATCITGGVAIFKEKEDYEKSLLIRDCGIDRSKFRNELGEIDPECDISLNGYSATMSDVNGYIGSQQMRHVDKIIAKQRNQACKWKKLLSDSEISTLDIRDTNPNYWVYGTLVDNKNDTIKSWRKKGFYASGVHMRNDLYSVFDKQDVELPGVDDFFNRFVALPCGWWMEENAI